MPTDSEIDISAWETDVTPNGAFGFRATFKDINGISGTGKTETDAILAARAKLRRHLGELAQKGTPLEPPASRPTAPASTDANSEAPFRLLDLLAEADANEPESAREQRLAAERWKSERDATSEGVQDVLKETIKLRGFSAPLAYDTVNEIERGDASGRAVAFTSGGDLKVVIACAYRLTRSLEFTAESVVVGLQRVSTRRDAQTDVPLTTLEGAPAIDRRDVHKALAQLVKEVAHGYEALVDPKKPLKGSVSGKGVREEGLAERLASLNASPLLGTSDKASARAKKPRISKR